MTSERTLNFPFPARKLLREERKNQFPENNLSLPELNNQRSSGAIPVIIPEIQQGSTLVVKPTWYAVNVTMETAATHTQVFPGH